MGFYLKRGIPRTVERLCRRQISFVLKNRDGIANACNRMKKVIQQLGLTALLESESPFVEKRYHTSNALSSRLVVVS